LKQDLNEDSMLARFEIARVELADFSRTETLEVSKISLDNPDLERYGIILPKLQAECM